MSKLQMVAASTLAAWQVNAASAEEAPQASNIPVGIRAEFKQGCALLYGNCDGQREGVAIRLGNSDKASELVLSATRFDEKTTGGYGHSYPVTFKGKTYGAVDYSLRGQQHLHGTVYGIDKFFRLGKAAVISVGGYGGKVTGSVGGAAEVGVTVSALNDTRFAIGRGYSTERSVNFGGLREAALVTIPTPQRNSFVTLNHYGNAGMDRAVVGLGAGYVYAAEPADRARLRPQACNTDTVAPRGLVVALNLCAHDLLMNPLGDKGERKLDQYAAKINGETAMLNRVGYAPPQVTGAHLAHLVGFEKEPSHSTTLQLRVSAPLARDIAVSAFAARSNTSRTQAGVNLAWNF